MYVNSPPDQYRRDHSNECQTTELTKQGLAPQCGNHSVIHFATLSMPQRSYQRVSSNKTRIAKQGSAETQFALCRLHGLSQLKGCFLRIAVTSACLFHPNGCPIHVVSHLHGNSNCMAVTIVLSSHNAAISGNKLDVKNSE